MASISRKSSSTPPQQFCQCPMLGNSPMRLITLRLFFAGFEDVFMGSDCGKSIDMLWVWVLEVTLVYMTVHTRCCEFESCLSIYFWPIRSIQLSSFSLSRHRSWIRVNEQREQDTPAGTPTAPDRRRGQQGRRRRVRRQGGVVHHGRDDRDDRLGARVRRGLGAHRPQRERDLHAAAQAVQGLPQRVQRRHGPAARGRDGEAPHVVPHLRRNAQAEGLSAEEELLCYQLISSPINHSTTHRISIIFIFKTCGGTSITTEPAEFTVQILGASGLNTWSSVRIAYIDIK